METDSESDTSVQGYDPRQEAWIIAGKSKRKQKSKTENRLVNELDMKPRQSNGKANGANDMANREKSQEIALFENACIKCNQTVTKTAVGLNCDICLNTFHSKCINMPEEAHCAITELNLFWICPQCESMKSDFQQIVAQGKTKAEKGMTALKDSLKEIEKSVESLASAIISQRPLIIDGFTSVHHALNKSKDISTSIGVEEHVKKVIQKETTVLYSDIVKTLDGKMAKIEGRQTSSPTAEQQVKSAMMECMQQEKRRKNIIIYGVPEPDGHLCREEKDLVELSKVEEISAKILRQKINITRAFRVGKPREGKHKPLVVELGEEREKWNILKAAPKLRSAGEEYKSIYLAPDLTLNEQKKRRALTGELQERKARGEDVVISKGRIEPRKSQNTQSKHTPTRQQV